MKNDFRRAKQHYLQAIGVQADCIEALYNLGYVNKKLNLFMQALQALQKIQTIISIPEVLFQIANINQIIGRTKQALKWYQIILTKLPNDPGILARIGSIFFRVIIYLIFRKMMNNRHYIIIYKVIVFYLQILILILGWEYIM